MLIKNMLFAYYQTQCLHVVSKLKIADYLENGPCHISKLANKLNVNESKLYRIMRFASALGLFDELADKTFQLNEESKYLLTSAKDSLNTFITLHGEYFYNSATKILNSLYTEITPFELEFGTLASNYFVDNDKAKFIYNHAMKENSELIAKEIIKAYDFSKFKNIIDIGGGVGSLLANILLVNKKAKGFNFDLPGLEEPSNRYIKNKQISDRCEFIGGDMFITIPSGGDLYIMKAILQGKSDEVAFKLLSSVKDKLNSEIPLLLIERCITLENNQLACYVNDINMLNVTQGYIRDISEYTNLLAKAGYEISHNHLISDSIVLFECKVKNI